MARHDNALQGVMLVALLVLFPMTIQLLVHQEESPLWKTVYVEVDSEDEEDAEARSESRNREDVARIATFNIKIFGETKMGKADVVSELVNITLRYDMVVVQENLIGNNGVVHMIDCIMYVQPSSDDDRLTQEIKDKYPITSCCMHNEAEINSFKKATENRF